MQERASGGSAVLHGMSEHGTGSGRVARKDSSKLTYPTARHIPSRDDERRDDSREAMCRAVRVDDDDDVDKIVG